MLLLLLNKELGLGDPVSLTFVYYILPLRLH